MRDTQTLNRRSSEIPAHQNKLRRGLWCANCKKEKDILTI